MHAIDGWLTDKEAFALFVAASVIQSSSPVAVEIGSFQGKSSVCIAGGLQHAGKGELYCVDPFDMTDEQLYLSIRAEKKIASLYGKFIANTWAYTNISRCVGFSTDMAEDYRIPAEIDMLFIDGNHAYESVLADVMTWVPRLKKGTGILAMHDVVLAGDDARGTWDTDPIRVVCDLGLGLRPYGWQHTTRVDSLFITQRTEELWTTLT